MRRRTKGAGLVETIVIATVLVPVTLFFLDLIVLVMANSINDGACKNAARVAANQAAPLDAVNAIEKAIAAYRKNSILKSIRIVRMIYDDVGYTTVSVETEVVVHLPIPFPGYNDVTFVAKDVEPILVKPTP